MDPIRSAGFLYCLPLEKAISLQYGCWLKPEPILQRKTKAEKPP